MVKGISSTRPGAAGDPRAEGVNNPAGEAGTDAGLMPAGDRSLPATSNFLHSMAGGRGVRLNGSAAAGHLMHQPTTVMLDAVRQLSRTIFNDNGQDVDAIPSLTMIHHDTDPNAPAISIPAVADVLQQRIPRSWWGNLFGYALAQILLKWYSGDRNIESMANALNFTVDALRSVISGRVRELSPIQAEEIASRLPVKETKQLLALNAIDRTVRRFEKEMPYGLYSSLCDGGDGRLQQRFRATALMNVASAWSSGMEFRDLPANPSISDIIEFSNFAISSGLHAAVVVPAIAAVAYRVQDFKAELEMYIAEGRYWDAAVVAFAMAGRYEEERELPGFVESALLGAELVAKAELPAGMDEEMSQALRERYVVAALYYYVKIKESFAQSGTRIGDSSYFKPEQVQMLEGLLSGLNVVTDTGADSNTARVSAMSEPASMAAYADDRPSSLCADRVIAQSMRLDELPFLQPEAPAEPLAYSSIEPTLLESGFLTWLPAGALAQGILR